MSTGSTGIRRTSIKPQGSGVALQRVRLKLRMKAQVKRAPDDTVNSDASRIDDYEQAEAAARALLNAFDLNRAFKLLGEQDSAAVDQVRAILRGKSVSPALVRIKMDSLHPLKLPCQYIVNEPYHVPHDTLVLVQAVFLKDSEFLRLDCNETMTVTPDHIIKANVRHRLYYGKRNLWYQPILDYYQQADQLRPARKPKEYAILAAEYIPLENEAEWLYLLRRAVTKNRSVWLRISAAMLIHLSVGPDEVEAEPLSQPEPPSRGVQSYWLKPLTARSWFLQALDKAYTGTSQLLISISTQNLTVGIHALTLSIYKLDEPTKLQQVTDHDRQTVDISTQRRRSLLQLPESIRRRRMSLHNSRTRPKTSSALGKGTPLRFVSNTNAEPTSYRERLLEGISILDAFVACPMVGKDFYNCGVRGYRISHDAQRVFAGAVLAHTLVDTSCLYGRTRTVALKHARAMRQSYNSNGFGDVRTSDEIALELSSPRIFSSQVEMREDLRFWPFRVFFQFLDAADKITEPSWIHRLRLGGCEHTKFDMFEQFAADLAQYRARVEVDTESDSGSKPLKFSASPSTHKDSTASKYGLPADSEKTSSPQAQAPPGSDPFFETLLVDHRAEGCRTFTALRKVFGFSSMEYECCLALLSVILHLRNLRFVVHNKIETYYVDDAGEPELTDDTDSSADATTPGSRFAASTYEPNSPAFHTRASSLALNVVELRKYVTGCIFTTSPKKDVNDKRSRLVPLQPCPISPISNESALVCCDLLKIPVSLLLALFSPKLARHLAARSSSANSETASPQVMFTPFDMGKLHDFPPRSAVYQDAPRMVYLPSDVSPSTYAQLPSYYGLHEWSDHDRCYTYRNLALSLLYQYLFHYIKKKLDSSLIPTTARELIDIEKACPELAHLSHFEFQSDLTSQGDGYIDSFTNFLRQLLNIWLHNRIMLLAEGTKDAPKLLADLLLNPIGPYYIRRLMVDYAADPSSQYFGAFLLNNLPSDAVSCIHVNKQRANIMELHTNWGLLEYETSAWKLIFDGHVQCVMKLWKDWTQSDVLKEVLADREFLLSGLDKIVNSVLANGQNLTLHINARVMPSVNDMYSLDLFEMICKYYLRSFGITYKNVHAPVMRVERFLAKYGILGGGATVADIIDPILSSVRSSTRAFIEQSGGVYAIRDQTLHLHPQIVNILDGRWLDLVNRKLCRVQAVWRGGFVRQRYTCLKQARKSIQIIQQAYKQAIMQQWDYFAPTECFPGIKNGIDLYAAVRDHENKILAAGVTQVQKELAKIKEDAYLLSECEGMLKREELKINLMETLLSQIVFENLKSPAIDQLALRLTKLKKQEALRRRIIKAIKISDWQEARRLVAMLPPDSEIMHVGLLKLKREIKSHNTLLSEDPRHRTQPHIRSFI